MARKKKEVLISNDLIKYKILKPCFVCNFGYKVGDVLDYNQIIKCLFNDGMIQNFINSNDIMICPQTT